METPLTKSKTNEKFPSPKSNQTSLRCRECSKTFIDTATAEQHMKRFHGKKLYVCRFCGVGYRCKNRLQKHVDSDHKDNQEINELMEGVVKAKENNENEPIESETTNEPQQQSPAKRQLETTIEGNATQDTTAGTSNGSAEDVDLSASNSKSKRPKKHHDSVGIPQFAESNNSQPNVSDVAAAGGDKASMASTAPKSANSSIASNNLQNNEDSQKHDDVSKEPEREQKEGDGKNENIVLPSISSSTVAAVSEVKAAPLSSSADVVTVPRVNLINASENPPVTLSTIPHLHSKWVCFECSMQFANPVQFQAHLSIHISKHKDCSACVQLCQDLEMAYNHLDKCMSTHNGNQAPSSSVAQSTTANPTAILAVSAVAKKTISTVANSTVVTAMATAAPAAAPDKISFQCEPSTSRGLPSSATGSKCLNKTKNNVTSSNDIVVIEISSDDDDENEHEIDADDLKDPIFNRSSTHYKCIKCGYKNRCQTKIDAHNLAFHPNEQADIILMHRCDECKMAFPRKCTLRLHQLKHTDRSPLRCRYCPRTFVSQNALSMHHNEHINVDSAQSNQQILSQPPVNQ